LLAVVKRPAALRWLRRIGRWTGLPRWKDDLARRLPAGSAWRAALQTWPDTAPAAVITPARPTHLSRVALFPGCIASVDDAVAQQAALKLLQAAGIPTSVLPPFCCGAIDLHGGAAAAAATAARRVQEAWVTSGAETLLTVTSGCLGTLRRALPEISVLDPLSVLADHADKLHFRPLALRAAVHLPCTLRNVAHSEQALLTLLRRVPALELTVLPADSCCGAAGSHLLEYPERAARLRGVILRQADALQPDLLLSSNIGCRLHLAAGMREQGLPWRHMHPLTLLAEQLADPVLDLP
jgi:glycolate oxidase iron-sulfur subunit